jgi:hypothetical protein
MTPQKEVKNKKLFLVDLTLFTISSKEIVRPSQIKVNDTFEVRENRIHLLNFILNS